MYPLLCEYDSTMNLILLPPPFFLGFLYFRVYLLDILFFQFGCI